MLTDFYSEKISSEASSFEVAVQRITKPRQCRLNRPGKEISTEKVSSWELERLGTALTIGDNSMPLGIVLKIGN